MKNSRFITILKWIARIWGGLAILIVAIAVFRELTGVTNLENDWRAVVLKSGLLVGLLLAYNRELIGGAIATAAVLISGFIHPVVLVPGLLYIVVGLLNNKMKSVRNLDHHEIKS